MSEQRFETVGDLTRSIHAIAKAGDREAASRFTRDYEDWLEQQGADRSVAMQNIGYCAGYTGDMGLILDVFNASHPVFGRETPSTGKALEAGKRVALGEFDA